MKKITAILLAAAPLWLTGCLSIQKTTAPAALTPTAWEYKVVHTPHMSPDDYSNTLSETNSLSPVDRLNARRQDFLNQLGKDGWILIFEENGSYYLKRPLK